MEANGCCVVWSNASYEVNWMTLTAVRSLAGQMHIALGYQNWLLCCMVKC